MPIDIHGKQYVTVAERIQEAIKEEKLTITTEVLFQNPVVIKATVVTKQGTFTGISAANPGKAIEKQSPYEVAETSAVGRALGFAGYGSVESISSADEIHKSLVTDEEFLNQIDEQMMKTHESSDEVKDQRLSQGRCPDCGAERVKNPKTGKMFCKDKCWLNK